MWYWRVIIHLNFNLADIFYCIIVKIQSTLTVQWCFTFARYIISLLSAFPTLYSFMYFRFLCLFPDFPLYLYSIPAAVVLAMGYTQKTVCSSMYWYTNRWDLAENTWNTSLWLNVIQFMNIICINTAEAQCFAKWIKNVSAEYFKINKLKSFTGNNTSLCSGEQQHQSHLFLRLTDQHRHSSPCGGHDVTKTGAAVRDGQLMAACHPPKNL